MGGCAGIPEERLPHLVRQIQRGSPQALGELYVAFAGDVFEVAHRVLGSTTDAEDVTGEVFLGMSVALRSYDYSSCFGLRRWLEKCTVSLAAGHARRLEATREVSLDSVRAPAARPDHPIDRIALERALVALTPALRTAFELKAVEGYSHREISAMLGIGVGASKVRLHRARKELYSLLADGI